MAVFCPECRCTRYEEADIDLGPLSRAIADRGLDALTVRDATGIALPKILKIMGITEDQRSRHSLTGYEIVQLAVFCEIPLSAILCKEAVS